MACGPTNSMILVISNPILRYGRPSEAEIEDCGMRKRAWPLAEIAQHENKPTGIFRLYTSISTYKRVYRLQYYFADKIL